MIPTLQNIKFLSTSQKREIANGQKEDMVVPEEGGRIRTWKSLVNLGIANRNEENLFSLKPNWKDLDIGLPPKAGARSKGENKIHPAEKLKGFTPDPPKGNMKRPPAEYSNCLTGTALVYKVLNGKKYS